MRRRSERSLSEEDVALWAHVTRGVRAYPGRKAPQPQPEPAASPPAAERSASESLSKRPAQPALKPLAPIERRMLTALKRGHEQIHAVLDLHGLRQDEAHARLIGFLRAEQARGGRNVLVITGKGASGDAMTGSERGVLKRVVPHWLRLPDLRAVVLGFEEASLRHGGRGALYVRLRRAGEGPR